MYVDLRELTGIGHLLVPGTIAGSLLPHQLLRDYGNLDATATVPLVVVYKGTEIVLSISIEEALELAYDWLSQYYELIRSIFGINGCLK